MVDDEDEYWNGEATSSTPITSKGPSTGQRAGGDPFEEAAEPPHRPQGLDGGVEPPLEPEDEPAGSHSPDFGHPPPQSFGWSEDDDYGAPQPGMPPAPLSSIDVVAESPPPPEAFMTSVDNDFRKPQRWVVIGPSGSGKSAFVSSLEQVVATGTEDGRDLRIDARNDACQELFTAAIDRLLDHPIAANAEAIELKFTLEARLRPVSGSIGAPFRVMNVELADAAGKWMFAPNGEHLTDGYATSGLDLLAAKWPTADSLLVMIPSYRASDNPIPINQEIRLGLSHLLRKMRTRHAVESEDTRSWLQRRWDEWRGRTVELPKARRLAFKRVLICVTMADVLAEQLLRDFQEWERLQALDSEAPQQCPLPPHIAALPNLTAREIAESLEPVATVRAKISDAAIQQILDAVAPGCPVAVALMSVKGFSEAGDPLTDVSGLANPASGVKTQRWRERIVNEWKPWGVRAALYFLATGEATPGAPLEILTAERLQEHR
jgi:hypothetical protein